MRATIPLNALRAWDPGVSKPHGSINLFVDEGRGGFCFARPYLAGGLPSLGRARNYLAFVPPRFNENYEQNPVTEAILDATRPARPDVVTFWGVGLTGSDADLLEPYRRWTDLARTVEFINPSAVDAWRAARLLAREVIHFVDVDTWHAGKGELLDGVSDQHIQGSGALR